MDIQVSAGGAILMLPSGALMGECCCGSVPPCEGGNCKVNTVPVVCPSMKVSLFMADYEGDNILWAGQTWTAAEVRAGAVKYACPTYYQLEHYSKHWAIPWTSFTAHLTVKFGIEAVNFGTGLQEQRRIRDVFSTGNPGGCNRTVSLVVRGVADLILWGGCHPDPYVIMSNLYLGLLSVNDPGIPTYNDYRLEGVMFNSVTIGGLVHTWEKGNNWP